MSFKSTLFNASVIGLSAAASAGFSPAWAQTSAQPEVTDNGEISEIIVTARRREESAQTVPVSVTAFSAEALEQRNVESLEDLTRVTPGLRYAAEGGSQNTSVSLRGLSKIPLGDGTPAVVTYFADVPMFSSGTNIPTFDLASVQVLKGPQGTLFGRNTVGGAVLVTPAAPTYDFGGYVDATYGDYNYQALEGAVNVPLVQDKAALRLSGQIRQRDGFVENVGVGPDLEDLDQYALRASFLVEPTESFRNTTIFDYFESDEAPGATILFNTTPAILAAFDARAGGLPLFSPFVPDLTAQFAAQQARGIRSTDSDVPGLAYQRELWGVTNKTELDLTPDIMLKNIFGYRSAKITYVSDTDGLPVLTTTTPFNAQPLVGTSFAVPLDRLILFNGGQQRNVVGTSDELQLLGTSFDNKLNWIVGAFYSKEEPNGPQGALFHQFDPFSSTTGIHLALPSGAVAHTTSESKALFGQIGLDLSQWTVEGLKLDLGYRYTWDDVDVCGTNIRNNPLNPFFTVNEAPFLDLDECEARARVAGSGVAALTTETNAPTWTIGLNYQINPDVFAYVVARRGYRQGGINSPGFNTPCTTGGPCVGGRGTDLRPFQTIDPEEVNDIELGLKTNWNVGDVRGRFNIDVFTMEYKDAIQFLNANGVVPTTDASNPLQGSFGFNAADLTIEGVELEGSLTPIDSLTFTATAAYTDQSVDEIGTVPTNFTLTAAQVTLPTPEWSATAGIRWTLPFQLLDGELALGGDYFWTDDWQAQAATMPSYDVTNFRLDWDNVGGRPLKASVFITNAFDEEYILSPTINLGGFPINTGLYGPPRQWGVEFSYKFGS